MYHADLHTHTIHSDGEYTPAHLGLMALQSGIRYLAYTDHNYSYSPAELSDLRLQFPMLRILRGCEFSCFYRTADQRRVEIHIVGLNFDPDCPELQAVLDEYHKPVVIQDEALGELTLDKNYDAFEGEIRWCGKDVLLSLEVNAESKPSWTRARSAAKKLLADCETWDKAMRELAAKNLTGLANNWLSQDEENPRNPETDPITEEELARRISMTSLSVTSGGSFTAYFDCDEMFTDHAATVYGSLKKGLKDAHIEG